LYGYLISECYDAKVIQDMDLSSLEVDEIAGLLNSYLSEYSSCLYNKSQRRYFTTFAKGLLSDLSRKTIEPIALSFLDGSDVRGFQQFFKRSNLSENFLSARNQNLLSQSFSFSEGILCVDGSDFVKRFRSGWCIPPTLWTLGENGKLSDRGIYELRI